MDWLRFDETPPLKDPVLIAAFAGWSDAAQSATSAARYLKDRWDAYPFAELDPEEFYDFTENRPIVHIGEGEVRRLSWPANEGYYFRRDGAAHDFIVLLGVEPNMHWRRFTDSVLELIRRQKVSLVLTLGGLLADVPHTRPVRVTGTSSNPNAAARLKGLQVTSSRYEGPTGIVGVLHDALRRNQIDGASIWANVPHYISAAINPKATAALLDRLDFLFDLNLDLDELKGQAQRFEQEVSDAVAQDEDASAYVRQLEERADADADAEPELPPSQPLPSGDIVVRELEEFLRRQRESEGQRGGEER
jgi:proteasome assembly chaperone (PAC2) family protein